jgi:hypothetical protein
VSEGIAVRVLVEGSIATTHEDGRSDLTTRSLPWLCPDPRDHRAKVAALDANYGATKEGAEKTVRRKTTLRKLVCMLVAAATLVALPAMAENKPNVVFILADNVGYGDLGPYGGGELRGAPTPRIDQLASEGLRLTQYLVEPGCTPSRAALMTGQYSIRNGLSLILVPGSERAYGRIPEGLQHRNGPA